MFATGINPPFKSSMLLFFCWYLVELSPGADVCLVIFKVPPADEGIPEEAATATACEDDDDTGFGFGGGC